MVIVLPSRPLVRTGLLLACIPLTTAVHAQDIHKCITRTSVAYQASPCGDGEIEAAVLSPVQGGARVADVELPAIVSARPGTPPPGASFAFPLGHRSLALGMTDDAVLNTPNWGPPDTITRMLGKHRWREVWVYASRGDRMRQLQFTNGKLTDIDADVRVITSERLASVDGR